MPELPEVETVCRGLAAALTGARLTRVEARRRDLRFPLPADFARRLSGRRVEAIGRRAKYMLWRLDGGLSLIGHLGMSGRMVVAAGADGPADGRHDHLVFRADNNVRVVFNDVRRFGFFDLCATDRLDGHRMLAGLGPEPLGDAFNGAALNRALAGRRGSIKAALLDQKLVAGLGNIYVCEALYLAGVSPRRRAGTVVGRRAERLVAAIRQVLNAAIAAGGSSLRDYVQASGELGWFQHSFAVYGRAGAPCPMCAAADAATACRVRRIVQHGRSTYYCALRQK